MIPLRNSTRKRPSGEAENQSTGTWPGLGDEMTARLLMTRKGLWGVLLAYNQIKADRKDTGRIS
jgi:hypothetical protein